MINNKSIKESNLIRIDKRLMLNFNHYLYTYITNNDNYQQCLTDTSPHYYEDDNIIRISIVYKDNQYQDVIYKDNILFIFKKFLYLSLIELDLEDIECFIIKNIGNCKNKINITIDINK